MLTLPNADVSLNSFRERSAGKRVVFFYPWRNFRTFFLTHFLTQERPELLYYRVTGDVKTLHHLLSDLAREFNQVLGNFGATVMAALETHDPQRMAQALAADLSALRNRPVIVYIDEFERVLADSDVPAFLDALVNALQGDVQIAFNSRLLSSPIMNALVARGQAAILGNVQHRRDLFFTTEAQAKPQLEIFAFGQGAAFLDGKEIASWDGMLPRNLFYYLIDHPLVTRDEIFADFWPEVPLKDATDIFHVTKHKVTEVMGRRMSVAGDYEITQYKQGFYLPSENLVRHYDVECFENAVEQALESSDPHEMEILLRQALDLYQAHYLEDSDAAWVVRRREQLMRLHCEACIWMARILEQRGERQETVDLYTQAINEYPQREDVHRAIIRLYLQLGRVDRAREQYRVLDRNLYQQLGITPTRESLELLRSIESAGAKPSK